MLFFETADGSERGDSFLYRSHYFPMHICWSFEFEAPLIWRTVDRDIVGKIRNHVKQYGDTMVDIGQ